MKRAMIFLMTVLFAVSVTNGYANGTGKKHNAPIKKVEGTVVSQLAKRSLPEDFGNVSDLQWQRGIMFDEATFTRDGKRLTAYYDSEGSLVGTTETKKYSDIPAKGREEISLKYKDYKPSNVILFDDNESNETNMFPSGSQLDDEDNFFVELENGPSKLVVKVSLIGEVEYFTKM
jgi:hypothetical protein